MSEKEKKLMANLITTFALQYDVKAILLRMWVWALRRAEGSSRRFAETIFKIKIRSRYKLYYRSTILNCST